MIRYPTPGRAPTLRGAIAKADPETDGTATPAASILRVEMTRAPVRMGAPILSDAPMTDHDSSGNGPFRLRRRAVLAGGLALLAPRRASAIGDRSKLRFARLHLA